MNTKNIRSATAVAITSLVLSSIMPLAAMAAVPSISSISPSSAAVGSSALVLTVNGSNFDSNAVVHFNGNAKATTYVSTGQLTAVIPAADLNAVGTFSVTVNNPSAGGGTSNAVSFTVGNVVPTTSSISPSSLPVGSGAFTLTVNGSNFIPSSVVHFNGAARTTTYVSSTQLMASMLASDSANAGVFNVAVVNTTPGGGTSNVQTFTVVGVNNPLPILTSISPTSVVAGSSGFTMTVNGVGFVPGSVVRFNGLVRTTTYVSSTKLTALIPASDVAITGAHAVYVQNPAPAGGNSNATLFTISPTSIVPGLPNTGFGPEDESGLKTGLLVVGIAGAMLAAFGARRVWLMKR